MNEEYDVLDIARYIINECNEKGIIISNLKLQKLLYFVQGYTFAFEGHRCFSNVIQAWDYGPVCPDAYHEFKRYGAMNIPTVKTYTECSIENHKIKIETKTYNPLMVDAKTREIIDAIIDNYGKYSATTLVEITHGQTPWEKTYYNHPMEKNVIISEELIRRYFENKVHGE